MDQAELYDQWQDNKDRPVWVRKHRDSIHDHTTTSDPVPDAGTHAVREWLSKYMGTVTSQLSPDGESADEDAETDAADVEGDGE